LRLEGSQQFEGSFELALASTFHMAVNTTIGVDVKSHTIAAAAAAFGSIGGGVDKYRLPPQGPCQGISLPVLGLIKKPPESSSIVMVFQSNVCTFPSPASSPALGTSGLV
jgi:hypothetical protein